jgi:L-ribulose-5-phosphate 4-epimerase
MEGMRKSRSKPRTEQQGTAELKKRLVEASWILAMEGHGDLVWGHASVRTPGSDTFWIKPTGMGLDEVRVEDLLLCNLDGEVVQGKGPRHIEVYIHSEVMRARPDVCAVVHTHAIYPTVFASLGVPLQPVTHEATVFVPPDIPRFDETTDLINTPERGRAMAQALGNRDALLLVSHGIVTSGTTIERAAINALLLDRATRAQLLLGTAPIKAVSNEVDGLAKRKLLLSDSHQALRWGYLKRDLARKRGSTDRSLKGPGRGRR